MNNKQLYEKLGQNSYDKVFPITYLQNILDKDTNNDLTVVLSRFNHLWIPYHYRTNNRIQYFQQHERQRSIQDKAIRYHALHWYGSKSALQNDCRRISYLCDAGLCSRMYFGLAS